MNAAGLGDRIYAMFGALRPEPLSVESPDIIYGGKPRHPRWHEESRQFISDQPFCVVCQTNRLLTVHHVFPYHLFPELEMDKRHWRVVCSRPHEDSFLAHGCHLAVGHCGWFEAYNRHFDEQADWLTRLHSDWRRQKAEAKERNQLAAFAMLGPPRLPAYDARVELP